MKPEIFIYKNYWIRDIAGLFWNDINIMGLFWNDDDLLLNDMDLY